MMTRSELHQLGSRLRTLGSTRGDWLTYIDGTLPLLTAAQVSTAPKHECPVCVERRRQKAKAQKNWRRKKERS
jgi:hypothetical protein